MHEYIMLYIKHSITHNMTCVYYICICYTNDDYYHYYYYYDYYYYPMPTGPGDHPQAPVQRADPRSGHRLRATAHAGRAPIIIMRIVCV